MAKGPAKRPSLPSKLLTAALVQQVAAPKAGARISSHTRCKNVVPIDDADAQARARHCRTPKFLQREALSPLKDDADGDDQIGGQNYKPNELLRPAVRQPEQGDAERRLTRGRCYDQEEAGDDRNKPILVCCVRIHSRTLAPEAEGRADTL
jgi:hypothetical protein